MGLKKLLSLLAVVLALGAGGVAFAAFGAPPTPEQILTNAANALSAAQDGHAVVNLQGSTSDKTESATIEVWGKKIANTNPTEYQLRIQVQQSSDAKLQGALFVSDGNQFWGYEPSQNTVWTGTVAQLRQLQSASSNPLPDSPQALVQQLLQISSATLAGTETVAGHSTYKLQLSPIANKAPQAALGATGFVWVDQTNWLALQASVNAGSTGHGTATATTLQLNVGVPASQFQFQVPAGAKVVPVQDQLPQHMSLSDAQKAAPFKLLQPTYTPNGAKLVDVFKVGQSIVLRYETPQGSFAVAEGIQDKTGPSGATAAPVSVRGAAGSSYVGQSGKEVLLVWTESGLNYSVSGALASQDALKIANSLQ